MANYDMVVRVRDVLGDELTFYQAYSVAHWFRLVNSPSDSDIKKYWVMMRPFILAAEREKVARDMGVL